MGLFDEPSAQQRTLQFLQDSLHGSLNTLRAAFDNGQMLVWENPYGLTPQEVFTALGENAGAMVAVSNATIAYINALAPEEKHIASKKPAETVLTVNEDGTVTLS